MNRAPRKELCVTSDEVELALRALELYATFCGERMDEKNYSSALDLMLKFKIEKQKFYVDFCNEHRLNVPIT